VVLHYRHVNQAERWQSTDLRRDGEAFRGEIPAVYTVRRYALQYYFEIETAPSEATLFPSLDADLANVPYSVVRRLRQQVVDSHQADPGEPQALHEPEISQ
jgi:hypothetical protein